MIERGRAKRYEKTPYTMVIYRTVPNKRWVMVSQWVLRMYEREGERYIERKRERVRERKRERKIEREQTDRQT